MRIFCDLDGVMADFDRHYEALFGPRQPGEPADWDRVRSRPHFFADMPRMPDAGTLWTYIGRYRPIILTGLPWSIESAEIDKRQWVANFLGRHVDVRCCASREKCRHAEPGDVLIDDREDLAEPWRRHGGIFILHTSAANTIRQLKDIGL